MSATINVTCVVNNPENIPPPALRRSRLGHRGSRPKPTRNMEGQESET